MPPRPEIPIMEWIERLPLSSGRILLSFYTKICLENFTRHGGTVPENRSPSPPIKISKHVLNPSGARGDVAAGSRRASLLIERWSVITWRFAVMEMVLHASCEESRIPQARVKIPPVICKKKVSEREAAAFLVILISELLSHSRHL